jgi:hypothetical protein
MDVFGDISPTLLHGKLISTEEPRFYPSSAVLEAASSEKLSNRGKPI